MELSVLESLYNESKDKMSAKSEEIGVLKQQIDYFKSYLGKMKHKKKEASEKYCKGIPKPKHKALIQACRKDTTKGNERKMNRKGIDVEEIGRENVNERKLFITCMCTF